MFSFVTEYSVTGQIGTKSERNVNPRARDTDMFYLNALNPATSAGRISVLQYCYEIPPRDRERHSLSTVAFYRPVENNSTFRQIPNHTYALMPNPELLNMDSDGTDCWNITIDPSVEVEVGDVIGACVTDFYLYNTDDVHRLRIAAEASQEGPFLASSLDSETEKCYCKSPGELLPEIDAKKLSWDNKTVLLVFAQISKLLLFF